MFLIGFLISLVVAVAVALAQTGKIVKKSQDLPAQIVFDMEESVQFCADSLPDSVTAQVSYDELSTTLRLHMEWLQAFHWTPDIPAGNELGSGLDNQVANQVNSQVANQGSTPIVFDSNEPLEYMIERADVVGLDLSDEQLLAIMDAHYEYLTAKGAIHVQDEEITQMDLLSAPELPRAE